MASKTLISDAGIFNVIGIDVNLQDSANPKLEAFTGVISFIGIDANLRESDPELIADPGIFSIFGKGVTDLAWNDFPREVVELEFEPLPIESFLIPAWPFITEVIILEPEFVDELIARDSYPYVTDVIVLEEYDEISIGAVYIDAGNPSIVIDLEFQPLPELTAIVGAGFNIIPLGCLDLPVEYWG